MSVSLSHRSLPLIVFCSVLVGCEASTSVIGDPISSDEIRGCYASSDGLSMRISEDRVFVGGDADGTKFLYGRGGRSADLLMSVEKRWLIDLSGNRAGFVDRTSNQSPHVIFSVSEDRDQIVAPATTGEAVVFQSTPCTTEN